MRIGAAPMTMLAWLAMATSSAAQEKPFVPEVGQPGKDVVWVPTPDALVEKMLDLAQLTPQDLLMDLGSGDGRVVIAAARRGARAIGVEYSRNMVELSRRNAAAAGVGDRAQFVEGDMFEADVSKASVLGLFLLPGNMFKLREKFLFMRPGSRIVANEYGVDGWAPDRRERLADCQETWCNALMWIVPARVHGAWQAPEGELVFDQVYQFTNGALAGTPIANGRLHAEELWFTAGDARYYGRVQGNVIEGTVTRGGVHAEWRATKR